MRWKDLGSRIPLKLLRKHGDRTDQIEAILFGVCRNVGKRNAAYPYVLQLKREFEFLKKKIWSSAHASVEMEIYADATGAFSNDSIGTTRKDYCRYPSIYFTYGELTSADEWLQRFMVIPEHEFWDDHYHFKCMLHRI